jgi:hypothetical protein
MNQLSNNKLIKTLYRLVKPYQSDKVYESSSIMHGAGKCYKELKKTNSNTPEFSIMDINTNHIYDFKVSPSPKMIFNKNPDELLKTQQNQEGGNDLNDINDINKINELKNIITDLRSRIEKLEMLTKTKNL